jgi:protein tyrosine/serine phosphatase
MSHPDGHARRVHWPDCQNARDLGGLPTTDGATIRRRALIRSDNLGRLTASGLDQLRGHGVRRVVDLRSAHEVEAEPSPLAGDPMYRLAPLIDPQREAERDRAAEPTLAAIYRASVERNAGHIVTGLAAIADAPPGAVVVHCAIGKDRTGMTVALALAAADVAHEVIAEDYAYTAQCLRAEHEAALSAVADDAVRLALGERQGSQPESILAMLEYVDDQYGGVREYLSEHGLEPAQFKRLRERLRGHP